MTRCGCQRGIPSGIRTLVAIVTIDLNALILSLKLFCYSRGGIDASVVDYQDFEVIPRLIPQAL
jgi:hypothetical protein